MKTGLVTFHAAHHYGAMLQAYALAVKAAEIGGECELIDYVRPDNLEAGRVFQRGFSPGVLVKNLHSLTRMGALKRRYNRFEAFLKETMPLSPKRYLTIEELRAAPPAYDVYLSGSDQIWNPFIFNEKRFDPAFFCDFPQTGRKISYAPSFGSAVAEGAVLDELSRYVKGFSHLSAREEHGASILQRAAGRDVPVVLDPTLLLEQEEWGGLAGDASVDKPYCLVYFISPPGHLAELTAKVKSRCNIRAVQLAGARRKMPGVDQIIYDAGPREFLALFQKASFVLTNSFHGVAFSVMFQRPFYCGAGSGEDGAASRTGHLLGTLGLADRLVSEPLSELSEIDYSPVRKRLRAERGRSLAYLKEALLGGT